MEPKRKVEPPLVLLDELLAARVFVGVVDFFIVDPLDWEAFKLEE
jgi:hypothetical protein